MKIGIFGGAFDPVHKEHIKIMIMSYNELKLDKLILLPSYFPPHKSSPISPFAARKRMLVEATKAFDFIEIDEREYRNDKLCNCSFEVLEDIKKDYPEDELIYIIGGDSMINFHTWVHPELIAKAVPIAVIARVGYGNLNEAIENAIKNYGARITLLSFGGDETSSSLIKAAYELGFESNLVTKAVSDIIKEEGLYRQFSSYIEKLKEALPLEKYTHSISTVLYAMKFANKLNLNYEKVFLAALLHDSAKAAVISNSQERFKDIPPKIIHQYLGAEYANEFYGIEDGEILDAIRYHTTGKKDMSVLGKLIYSADMLEAERDYPGVEDLRLLIESDFDKGFLACVEGSVKNLEDEGRDVYYLTKECYDFYKKQIKKEKK